jgi:serine/threonine-protein kinase HipA
MVFNIAISNCDDHLRNHGFLLSSRGWTLSPVYDINPDERGAGLKLNISENDNSLDFGLALDVCSYFRLSRKRAEGRYRLANIREYGWRVAATRCGISKREQDRVKGAFRRG